RLCCRVLVEDNDGIVGSGLVGHRADGQAGSRRLWAELATELADQDVTLLQSPLLVAWAVNLGTVLFGRTALQHDARSLHTFLLSNHGPVGFLGRPSGVKGWTSCVPTSAGRRDGCRAARGDA